MAKQPFFPDDLPGQILWENNFRDELPPYANKYGISTQVLDDLDKDRKYMNFWYDVHTQTQLLAQGVTQFKNELAFGVPQGQPPTVAPTFPDLSTAPPAVAPGVFTRALAVANGI